MSVDQLVGTRMQTVQEAIKWIIQNKGYPEYCERQIATYRRVCGNEFADEVIAKVAAGVVKK